MTLTWHPQGRDLYTTSLTRLRSFWMISNSRPIVYKMNPILNCLQNFHLFAQIYTHFYWILGGGQCWNLRPKIVCGINHFFNVWQNKSFQYVYNCPVTSFKAKSRLKIELDFSFIFDILTHSVRWLRRARASVLWSEIQCCVYMTWNISLWFLYLSSYMINPPWNTNIIRATFSFCNIIVRNQIGTSSLIFLQASFIIEPQVLEGSIPVATGIFTH